MLSSFEVRNFRVFSHLSIRRLGRVNLIVGKNNVGKTTLLEALRFYVMGSATALREYLVDHDELAVSGVVPVARLDFPSLFHGRGRNTAESSFYPVEETGKSLTLRLIDMEQVEESDGGFEYVECEDDGTPPEGEIVKGLAIHRADARVTVTPEPTRRSLGQGRHVGPPFISAQGVRESDLSQWWEEIALTSAEERVLEGLRLLAPVERITTKENPLDGGRRAFFVRLRGENSPVPLRSLGGGALRLFQTALALEYARQISDARWETRGEGPWQPGMYLLIDEIENGFHHSIHQALWSFVVRLARLRNVQVFATTHSWDCLRGFAEAVREDESNDGMVIRLEKLDDGEATRAVLFDREDLPIVVRDSIEVR